MKITTKWLAEYVDCAWDWRELVDRLTISGLEFEGVDQLAQRFEGVVVGSVLECEGHPNADRLSVCKVDVGGDVNTIVCGAPNVASGQKVAVALPGCTLPGDFTIKRAKIRGIESLGMICAEDELGLGDNHDGIMVLDDALEPGTPFAIAAGLDDIVLDFEVTPNRPDCLSVVGIAREVRALTGNPLSLPPCDVSEQGAPCADDINISIEHPNDCPRYVGRVIRGVKVGPSPQWLQRRLQAVGQRPINNIVDITNYVLLELGQPLHAFDLHKLSGRQIVVRRAREDESIETLDGVSRKLDSNALVIADGERPVALAGIMGGANSEVDEHTADIVLESAYFDPSRIRQTKAHLGLHTEAASRFERGADWDLCLRAANRAAMLIAEYAGGRIAEEAIDVYPIPRNTAPIHLRLDRANRLLATHFSPADAQKILESLDCKVENDGEDMRVTPPSFRPDLLREADLVEELGRIYGYDRIPGSQRANGPWLTQLSPALYWKKVARQRMADIGLDEILSNTIVDASWEQHIEAPCAIELANPPTEAQSLLRTRLLPSLLEVARRNFNQRARSLALFELGKCFSAPRADAALPQERWNMAALYAGPLSTTTWQGPQRDLDFYDLKGVLERLADAIPLEFEPVLCAGYRPGHCASVTLDGNSIGHIGQAAPDLCAAFDIEAAVYIFELDFATLVNAWQRHRPAFVHLPKFPAAERDLSVIVSDDVSHSAIAREIIAGALVESVEFFDLYQGEPIESGHKSLSFSIRLRHPERTLKDKQADAAINEILKKLQKRFGAHLR